jgi:hypothetical protein
MITPSDGPATAAEIVAGGTLRLGVLAWLLVVVLDVVIAWALYRVFRPVSPAGSMLTAVFRLVYAAVLLVAVGQLWAPSSPSSSPPSRCSPSSVSCCSRSGSWSPVGGCERSTRRNPRTSVRHVEISMAAMTARPEVGADAPEEIISGGVSAPSDHVDAGAGSPPPEPGRGAVAVDIQRQRSPGAARYCRTT